MAGTDPQETKQGSYIRAVASAPCGMTARAQLAVQVLRPDRGQIPTQPLTSFVCVTVGE